jgi:hypothetical protein
MTAVHPTAFKQQVAKKKKKKEEKFAKQKVAVCKFSVLIPSNTGPTAGGLFTSWRS